MVGGAAMTSQVSRRAAQALARIAELESLAEERLDVIRAMKNGRAG